MKTLRKLGYLLIFGSLLMLDSCLPTDEVIADRIPKLTSSTWKYSQITNDDELEREFYDGYFAGQEIDFFTDGTYSQNLVIYNESGNWEFNTDQTVLFYDVGTSQEQVRTILTLSNSQFEFSTFYGSTEVKVLFTH